MNITWQCKNTTCNLKIDISAVYLPLEKVILYQTNKQTTPPNPQTNKHNWNLKLIEWFQIIFILLNDQGINFMFVN